MKALLLAGCILACAPAFSPVLAAAQPNSPAGKLVEALSKTVYEDKVADGISILARIHHLHPPVPSKHLNQVSVKPGTAQTFD